MPHCPYSHCCCSSHSSSLHASLFTRAFPLSPCGRCILFLKHMETTPSIENPELSIPLLRNDAVDQTADHNPVTPLLPDSSCLNHSANSGESEPKQKPEFSEEEMIGILQVVASTGKFWHDWDKLKSVLSFQLKQILSEYPEGQMTTEEQNASLGESYPELVKRLDAALHNFDEGPPFTLQRLCEILLAARSIYPNLWKLALALEKNLLVTSTLSVCTDPYPQVLEKPEESDKSGEEPQMQSSSVQNGVEHSVGDRDEIMTEVDEADIEDDMTIDMEALEEIVASSEANATPTGKS